jgi:hypothetical protein
MRKSTRPARPWGVRLSDWDEALQQLDPALARQVRDAAGRAGLQAHDPAARLIAEMWVAVAALRAEREQLRQEMTGLRRSLDRSQQFGRVLMALVALHLCLFVGWLAW